MAGAAVLFVSLVALLQRAADPTASPDIDLATTFLRDLIVASAWVVVGLGVVRLARAVPPRLGWTVCVHVVAAGVAGLAVNLMGGAGWAVSGLWPGGSFGEVVLAGTVRHLHSNTLLYALIVGATAVAGRVRGARAGEVGGGGIGETGHADGPGRIAVPHRGRTVLVDVERIGWIEADGDYVTVHADGRSYLVPERMGAMEARLDPDRFARTHRSAIVNLDLVREVRPEPAGNATLVLDGGTEVPLSRRRRARIEARLGV